MHRNVEDWERVASVAGGAGLLAVAVRQRPAVRAAAAAAGLGLIARGVAGYCPVNAATGRDRRRDDTRRALGGPLGIRLHEHVIVDAPVEALYAFWREPTNLPQVLPMLERVDRLDDRRSHWTIKGPAGVRLEWDAEIINDVPHETIGWRSLPGADVASAGSVRFRPTSRGGTRVDVRMQYDPPAGKVGAAVAPLFGRSAGRQVRQALRLLKHTFEGPAR